MQHTFSGAGAPTFAPTGKGQHYTDNSNGDIYISNGTASSANWVNMTTSAGDINQLTGDVTAGPGGGSQAATIANGAVTNAKVATGIDAAKLADGSVSNTEFQYINSLTSNAQTQLDAKVDENVAITGATKTKITYDAKGLVTAGADAAIADITGLSSALAALVPYTGATGNVDLGSTYKVINAVDPTSAQDYATKNYVDNIITPTDLSITKTGDFSYDYSFQFGVPSKYSYKGTMYAFTGKWLELFTYSESLSLGVRGLTTISFDDLEGTIGAIGFNLMQSLTTASFPVLKFMGGGLSMNNCPSLTSFSVPNLEGVVGTVSFQTTQVITSVSFPELKFIGSSINLSGLALCTTISMPNLESCGGGISVTSMAVLTSLSFPKIVYVNGSITPSGTAALTTYDFPLCQYVTGTIGASGLGALTTMNFPSLLKVGGINALSANALTTMTFPLLTHCTANISLSVVNGLTTLSLPSLQYLYGTISLSGTTFATLNLPSMISYTGSGTTISFTSMASLTSATIGTIGTLKSIAGNITFSACGLTQASVDGILKLLVSLDGTSGTTLWGTGKTLTLSGGTNAAPSYTGPTPPTVAGSSFVGSGTTCTVSWVGHGYTTGDLLTISGITTLTNANGTFQITVVNANTFTYTIVSQTATGGGTATVKKAGAVTDGFYARQQLQVRGATVTTN